MAELVDQTGGICLRIVRSEKIVFPGEYIVDTGPAGLHEQRGRYAAARRHAAEMKRFLNMFGVAIPSSQAGGLMRGVPQHPAHLLGVQAGRATRGSRCTKERRDTVRAPMTLSLEALSAEGNG